MAKTYVVIIKGHADWITFCRAHFLKMALLHPSRFGGIHWFDPAKPKSFMSEPGAGWTVFLCGHGDKDVICGVGGRDLANALGPCLPNEEGRVNVMSCSTGRGSADDFTTGLRALGKKVTVVAPSESCTFNSELFFRVLNPPLFDQQMRQKYQALTRLNAVRNGDAATLATRAEKEDIAALCKEMAQASQTFWTEFNRLFAGCFSKPGEGWKEFTT